MGEGQLFADWHGSPCDPMRLFAAGLCQRDVREARYEMGGKVVPGPMEQKVPGIASVADLCGSIEIWLARWLLS